MKLTKEMINEQAYIPVYSVALTGILSNPTTNVEDVAKISKLAAKYADQAMVDIKNSFEL